MAAYPGGWAGVIRSIAPQYNVDPEQAVTLANFESGLNPGAVSSAGAVGLFQVLPSTGAGLGYNVFDPVQNIQAGLTYWAQKLAQFGGNPSLAYAYGYNPGYVGNGPFGAASGLTIGAGGTVGAGATGQYQTATGGGVEGESSVQGSNCCPAGTFASFVAPSGVRVCLPSTAECQDNAGGGSSGKCGILNLSACFPADWTNRVSWVLIGLMVLIAGGMILAFSGTGKVVELRQAVTKGQATVKKAVAA